MHKMNIATNEGRYIYEASQGMIALLRGCRDSNHLRKTLRYTTADTAIRSS